MRVPLHAALVGTALVLGCPAVARAGMPSVTLDDVARMRVQTISFFLLLLLLSAWLIQFLWNRLRTDFSALPRLTYGKALGVVVLWGLLFVLVLTMISGARELMTPGAWEKTGSTYRLAREPAAPPADDALEKVRREKLDNLRYALWNYALTHEARFPSDPADSGIPAETWQVPDPSGMRYIYVGGQVAGRGARPLAYEPELFGRQRFVLLTTGEIRRMETEEIVRALGGGNGP